MHRSVKAIEAAIQCRQFSKAAGIIDFLVGRSKRKRGRRAARAPAECREGGQLAELTASFWTLQQWNASNHLPLFMPLALTTHKRDRETVLPS